MPTTFLSVDLGNSRCKLCLWTIDIRAERDHRAELRVGADRRARQERPAPTQRPTPAERYVVVSPELRASHEFESRTGLGAAVSDWLNAEQRPDSAALSSVAARALEDELCAVIEERVNGRFEPRPDPGIAIECRAPDAVGRDRVFAARGAWEIVRSSAIIVDAGTALTVDALRADGSRATFLGGAIAPGPRLLAESLARGTARLPLVEPRAGARALGRDTEEALQSGVVVGFRGAARELVERIGAEAALENAPVVVTGGAREVLLSPSAFGSRAVREVPDLVHRGLIAACCAPPSKP